MKVLEVEIATCTPSHRCITADFPGSLLYHEVMIQLCEFLQANPEPTDTENSQRGIRERLKRSRVCFETIMRLYYVRHGFEGADSYITYDLAVLAFIAQANLKTLRASTDAQPMSNTTSASSTPYSHLSDLDDTRATLFLAAKGLHLQGKSYPLPRTLFHVVQSMRPEDAAMMHRYADIRPESSAVQALRAEYARSQYPVLIVDTDGHVGKNYLGGMVARLRRESEVASGRPGKGLSAESSSMERDD
jgi:hypothetical protein